jgi:hypothetical protein
MNATLADAEVGNWNTLIASASVIWPGTTSSGA